MVVGLEEPILIKGVGEILAKIDSGNAGYNVIHGEDLTVQGDILTFKTQNKDGKDRRVSKKIKEKLNVNIGGGHVQERPVVELDVQIGGQEYKKILFSVTDRSSNDNKVLISADFVGKELDALIDVNKKKIADNNIEVDYVAENTVSNFFKSAASRVGAMHGIATDTTSSVKKGKKVNGVQQYKMKTKNPQKNGNFLDRLHAASVRAKKWVSGEGKLFDDIEQFFEGPALINNFLKSDAEEIKKAVKKNQSLFKGMNVNFNDIQVYKFLDFLGGTCIKDRYVDQKEIEAKRALKDKLKDLQEKIKSLKKQLKENGIDEKTVTKNGIEEKPITEDTQPTNPNEEPKEAQPTDPTKNSENTQLADPNKDLEEAQNEVKSIKDELEKIKKREEGRNFFIIYYAAFGSDKEGNKLAQETDITKGIENIIIEKGKEIIMPKAINEKILENYVDQFKEQLNKNKTAGIFAYCVGNKIPRAAKIVKNTIIKGESAGLEDGTDKEKNQLEKFVKIYKKLNDTYMNIAKDIQGQPSNLLNFKDLNALINLAKNQLEK